MRMLKSHLKAEQNSHGRQREAVTWVREGRGGGIRIRRGNRQERGAEGQENEWKSAAAEEEACESLGGPRALEQGRLPGANAGNFSEDALQWGHGTCRGHLL